MEPLYFVSSKVDMDRNHDAEFYHTILVVEEKIIVALLNSTKYEPYVNMIYYR